MERLRRRAVGSSLDQVLRGRPWGESMSNNPPVAGIADPSARAASQLRCRCSRTCEYVARRFSLLLARTAPRRAGSVRIVG
jgi:hypothetical protein